MVSQLRPSAPLGATEWFSGGHKLRPLQNSSAVIIQTLIDEQGATSVKSFERGHKPWKVEKHCFRHSDRNDL